MSYKGWSVPALAWVLFPAWILSAGSPIRAAEGAVYVLTNERAANGVVIFDRAADGRLTRRATILTGAGAAAAPVSANRP